jgi:hypothetical protein
MTRHLPLTGLLAALALAAAGCGIGSPAAGARPTANPVTVYHEVAQCIRDHGMPDFPDPTVDAQGQPHLPDSAPTPPDAIIQACRPILNQLPASLRPHTDANDPAMMRRFAQCMRGHGIDDWPDPDAEGNFHFPPSLLGNLKPGSPGPRTSQVQAAWNGPCKQYDPSGHISTAP